MTSIDDGNGYPVFLNPILPVATWHTVWIVVPVLWFSSIHPTNGQPSPVGGGPPSRAERLALADEFDRILFEKELAIFYPGCLDAWHGGFKQASPERWASLPADQREKSLVYQARMTWTAAEVADRRPAFREVYEDYARHGFRFLNAAFWDVKDGGFYAQVSEDGGPSRAFGRDKFAYGMAFGIYACAQVYMAIGDTEARDLAREAFRWMETHAHDPAHGGYYEAYTRSGEVLKTAENAFDPGRGSDPLGTRYGYKSMNAHIHLLEAFSSLYRADPDPRVRKRLEEVFWLVRDVITVDPPGAMNQFFTPNWRVLPYPDSFGHDVETTYLLLEAAEALGLGEDETTRARAFSLTRHALDVGWDAEYGGFHDEGPAFGRPHVSEGKAWWAQAEGLNSLLLLYEKTGEPRYWDAFLQLWGLVKRQGVDMDQGGWRSVVYGDRLDSGPRVHRWKTAYHTTRAMLNVADRLRAMPERP